MKLLKSLFGRTLPMDNLRQACDRREWARALAVGQQLERAELSPDDAGERDRLLLMAGNSLAQLNLEEGEACRRLGDEERAREHFGLALGQARDPSLRERVEAALQGESLPQTPLTPKSASSCGSCASAAPAFAEAEAEDDLDPLTRFDLILASYPPELAQRYLDAPAMMRDAFLLAHAGQHEEALRCLEQIPSAQRDELFHFELGTLLARFGEVSNACAALETAANSPTLRMYALESLITLQLASGQGEVAKKRLLALLAIGEAPAFCHTRLAFLAAAQGHAAKALEHGRQAMALGVAEPELLRLLASILEKDGCLPETEQLLTRLPGTGGCSGGTVSVHLAEFWLRHNMDLDRCLEAFKGASRAEPANPRWPLRVAQTYLRRGWKKEGLVLLEKVLTAPELDPELYREGQSLLEANR